MYVHTCLPKYICIYYMSITVYLYIHRCLSSSLDNQCLVYVILNGNRNVKILEIICISTYRW